VTTYFETILGEADIWNSTVLLRAQSPWAKVPADHRLGKEAVSNRPALVFGKVGIQQSKAEVLVEHVPQRSVLTFTLLQQLIQQEWKKSHLRTREKQLTLARSQHTRRHKHCYPQWPAVNTYFSLNWWLQSIHNITSESSEGALRNACSERRSYDDDSDKSAGYRDPACFYSTAKLSADWSSPSRKVWSTLGKSTAYPARLWSGDTVRECSRSVNSSFSAPQPVSVWHGGKVWMSEKTNKRVISRNYRITDTYIV